MNARQFHTIDGEFAMHRGGTLLRPTVAYETWGRLNDSASNAVLIVTGLSPSAHAASSRLDQSPGWWEEVVGPGKPIDTNRFFVVCVNSLGSCFGSTGPSSVNPATSERYRLDFPVLSLEDVANGAWHVVRSLGIERLHAIVGPSMGGMTALAFELQHPGMCRGLVSISSAARAEPFAIALRSLQREIVRRDPAWEGGDYPAGEGPIAGMRLARKLGMITYRSADEWLSRFARERVAAEKAMDDPFCVDFEVESYLESHAVKFTGQFDPNCYLYLSRAMDLFDVADHGGSVSAGLAETQFERVLVIGVHTDILFPLRQQEELAAELDDGNRHVKLARLRSIQGHDSFLVDMDRFRPAIAEYFRDTPH